MAEIGRNHHIHGVHRTPQNKKRRPIVRAAFKKRSRLGVEIDRLEDAWIDLE